MAQVTIHPSAARRINRQLRPFRLTLGTIPVWLGGLVIAVCWGAPFVWMIPPPPKPPGEVMAIDIEWLPPPPPPENYPPIFFEFPLPPWGFKNLFLSLVH